MAKLVLCLSELAALEAGSGALCTAGRTPLRLGARQVRAFT